MLMDLTLSEKEVTRQIVDYMLSNRWYPIRMNSGLVSTPDGRRIKVGQAGVPDYIFIRATDYVLVEMKRPGGSLSPAQKDWHRYAEIAGFPVIVADGLGTFIAAYRERWVR